MLCINYINNMRILGIDPSTVSTGVGILDIDNDTGKVSTILYGEIAPKKTDSMQNKLSYIYEDLKELIDEYKPTCISVETPFYSKNVKVLLALGQIRGVVLLLAGQFDLKLFEYSPREVKKNATGNGAAKKEQVTYMVEKILKIDLSKATDDASDALAVAMCYANNFQFLNKVK